MHNQAKRSTRSQCRNFWLALLVVLIPVVLAGHAPQLSVANSDPMAPVAYMPIIRRSKALVPTTTMTPTTATTATPTRPAPTATLTNTPTASATSAPTASLTPTQAPSSTLDISGTVYFHPRYHTVPMTRPPHAYVVVLDVSSSMSWNFAGLGTRNGQDIQCGTPADPSMPRAVCGPESPWRITNERRIYIAKQALMYFIDSLEPNDTMRLVAYGDSITTTVNWSNDKTALKQAVLAAGQYKGDPYWTAGRSSNASGLYAARQALAEAPPTTPDLMYEQVVIFLTDSVANQLLAADGSPQFYSGADICPNNAFATDTATCMAGYLSDGTPRPITAMVSQGELLKQISTVYVVGLAGVDETGLRLVASASNFPFFSVAFQPADLTGILDTIYTTIRYGDCVPRGGDDWSNTIHGSHTGDVPPPLGPLSDTVVGYLYLSDEGGNPLPGSRGKAPIRRDPQTDKLSYHVVDLAPGTYQVQGFVAYKGDDDVSRVYTLFFERDRQLLVKTSSFTLPLPPSGVPGPADLYLDMNGSVCPTS